MNTTTTMRRGVLFFGLLLLKDVTAQNDKCDTAIPLGILPANANGNTMTASLHLDTQAQSCRLVSGPRRSSWFVYQPDSPGCVTASAKAIDDPTTQDDAGFDTAVAVYSGDSCADLSCLAMNDDETVFSVTSKVHFDVEAGTKYYIMVTGWNSEVKGSFELNVEKQEDEACTTTTGRRYCNVCPENGVPGPAAMFNQNRRLLCSEAPEYFGAIEGTELCDSMQLLGSAVCSCEYPADHQVEKCKLCPSGHEIPDTSIKIDAIGETCGLINDLEGSVSCTEIYRRGLASQCKCPGTLECDLCGGLDGVVFDPKIEITRGATCRDAQQFVKDMFSTYPTFLGCDTGHADFYYQANVREVCCLGGTLNVVQKQDRTIPPSSSPSGSNGANVGNGGVNNFRPTGNMEEPAGSSAAASHSIWAYASYFIAAAGILFI